MFNATILRFYNSLKNTHLTMDDFKSYKYWEVWGGTYQEVALVWIIDIVHAFFKSPMFLDGVGVDVLIESRSLLFRDRRKR